MSSQVKVLIGAGAVLLFLVGITIALIATAPKGSSEEVITTAPPKTRLLYDLPPQNLLTLNIKNETGELLIERFDIENTYIFTVMDMLDLPLDNEKILSVAEAACTLTATEVLVENAADLSPYGLTTPQAEFTAVFDDSKGSEKHIVIGDKAPDGLSYYAAYAGENTVYLISLSALDPFTADTLQVINRTLYTEITAQTEEDTTDYKIISEMNVTRRDLPYEVLIRYDKEAETGSSYGTSLFSYRIESPIDMAIDAKRGESVLTGVFGLRADSVEKLRPTEEDLEAYGLSEPAATVNFALIDKNLTLKIGNAYDGGHYCTVSDKNVIWKLSDIKLPWLTFNPLGITAGLVFNTNVYDISSIDFTGNGIDAHFISAGTSSEDMTVTLNGTESDALRFRQLYQFVLMTPATELYLEPVTGDPYFTVLMKGKDLNDKVEFYDIGERRYAIVINDKPQFVCTSTYVDRLVQNVKNYETGGEILTDF
jgi:hypothetical protein